MPAQLIPISKSKNLGGIGFTPGGGLPGDGGSSGGIGSGDPVTDSGHIGNTFSLVGGGSVGTMLSRSYLGGGTYGINQSQSFIGGAVS